jgi:HTH-type transcriptional regulator / antitoxin HipB
MTIESILDLASTVRARRLELGLSQAQLASRAKVSREWLNSLERGKASVELLLVLRVIEALDLRMTLGPPEPEPGEDAGVDLDALIEEYRIR